MRLSSNTGQAQGAQEDPQASIKEPTDSFPCRPCGPAEKTNSPEAAAAHGACCLPSLMQFYVRVAGMLRSETVQCPGHHIPASDSQQSGPQVALSD